MVVAIETQKAGAAYMRKEPTKDFPRDMMTEAQHKTPERDLLFIPGNLDRMPKEERLLDLLSLPPMGDIDRARVLLKHWHSQRYKGKNILTDQAAEWIYEQTGNDSGTFAQLKKLYEDTALVAAAILQESNQFNIAYSEAQSAAYMYETRAKLEALRGIMEDSKKIWLEEKVGSEKKKKLNTNINEALSIITDIEPISKQTWGISHIHALRTFSIAPHILHDRACRYLSLLRVMHKIEKRLGFDPWDGKVNGQEINGNAEQRQTGKGLILRELRHHNETMQRVFPNHDEYKVTKELTWKTDLYYRWLARWNLKAD